MTDNDGSGHSQHDSANDRVAQIVIASQKELAENLSQSIRKAKNHVGDDADTSVTRPWNSDNRSVRRTRLAALRRLPIMYLMIIPKNICYRSILDDFKNLIWNVKKSI